LFLFSFEFVKAGREADLQGAFIPFGYSAAVHPVKNQGQRR
jgi:hypothetical protein